MDANKANENKTPQPTIALVDDDPIFGKMMVAAAEKRGVHLTYHRSVREMYQTPDWHCDLVIADYDLGRVTGIQLTHFMEHYLKKVPVIIVSASELDPDRRWPNSVKAFVGKKSGPNAIIDEAIKKWNESNS